MFVSYKGALIEFHKLECWSRSLFLCMIVNKTFCVESCVILMALMLTIYC
jgi:hypothetical protein